MGADGITITILSMAPPPAFGERDLVFLSNDGLREDRCRVEAFADMDGCGATLKSITPIQTIERHGPHRPVHEGAWNARANHYLSREEQDERVRWSRIKRALLRKAPA